jgi:hypothetical protein
MIAMTVMTVNAKNTVPVKKTAQHRRGRPLQFYAADEFIEALDRWRAQQPGLPGRSEAIRKLVEQALAEPKKRR